MSSSVQTPAAEDGENTVYRGLPQSQFRLRGRPRRCPPHSVAQSLARHSDIRLTMDYHTHAVLEDRLSALEQLPDLTLRASDDAADRGAEDRNPCGQVSAGPSPSPLQQLSHIVFHVFSPVRV